MQKMVDFEWKNAGGKPSEDEIRRIEATWGIEVPQELVEFWRDASNGGRPLPPPCFDVPGLEGGAGWINGVYGIGTAHKAYELETAALPHARERLKEFFPMAFDVGGGELVIALKKEGHPIYYFSHDPDGLYWCANSLTEFLGVSSAHGSRRGAGVASRPPTNPLI